MEAIYFGNAHWQGNTGANPNGDPEGEESESGDDDGEPEESEQEVEDKDRPKVLRLLKQTKCVLLCSTRTHTLPNDVNVGCPLLQMFACVSWLPACIPCDERIFRFYRFPVRSTSTSY